MNLNKEQYKDREQTYIKHLFLRKYLEEAAYKLMQGRDPVLNFVDGFAGPWNTSSDGNLEDTSFAQSIEILNGVQDALQERGVVDARVRFFFCEENKSSFNKLKKFVEKLKEKEDICLFQGKFEDNLENISSRINNEGFTITFLDPTGFSVSSQKICNFLKIQNGEFLFNFMAHHINRFPTHDPVKSAYAKLLANQDWREDYNKLPDNLSGEERILTLLKNVFHDLSSVKFVPDLAISKPKRNQLQMRLVLGTNSIEGVALFRKIHKTVELQEHKIKIDKKTDNQKFLFTPEYLAKVDQEAFGFGCKAEKEFAINIILSRLNKNGETEFKNLWPYVLEQAYISLPDVRKILIDLYRDKKVNFKFQKQNKKILQSTTLISATGYKGLL